MHAFGAVGAEGSGWSGVESSDVYEDVGEISLPIGIVSKRTVHLSRLLLEVIERYGRRSSPQFSGP